MHVKTLSRILGIPCATLALLLAGSLPARAQVAVTLNGDQLDIAPQPIIQDGRVFVPLRGIFERLGASVVYWSGTINATDGDRTISLQIGSTAATVDGRAETVDVAPFIIGASARATTVTATSADTGTTTCFNTTPRSRASIRPSCTRSTTTPQCASASR